MTTTNSNEESSAEIKTPFLTISARGTLMVVLLGLIGNAFLIYWVWEQHNITADLQTKSLSLISDNQRRLYAGIMELSCISSIPQEQRLQALKNEVCESFLDKRLKKFDNQSFKIQDPEEDHKGIADLQGALQRARNVVLYGAGLGG